MAHPRSRLTPYGRLLLVQRICSEGFSAAQAAKTLGVSRATAYKWLWRYRQEGAAGLEDRPSRARCCRHALGTTTVELILLARSHYRRGPHWLAGSLELPRSTIYGVLRRHGCSRLRDFDRVTAAPIRYVRETPGELVHFDIKKLGRIPPDGGHHFRGRIGIKQGYRRNQGFDYLHVAVDDSSRTAFVQILPDERGTSTAAFASAAIEYFGQLGVPVQRVLTDQGRGYVWSRSFAEILASAGVRHLVTRPYRPQTNGKAERFIRTLLAEWAYARPYSTNADRLDQLAPWLDFYNRRRPHTALRGQSPLTALVNKGGGNYS